MPCVILFTNLSIKLLQTSSKKLSDIISESQSVFQSDKAISDNILVAFEMLYHMNTQKLKKADFMTLKLNMSKAYDGVE